MKSLIVYQKEITKCVKPFISRTAKNKKGKICKVSFVEGTEEFIKTNIKDLKPFVINMPNNGVSYKEYPKYDENKKPILNKKGEQVIERIFYVRFIDSIGEFIPPDIDDDIL